tara:strand:- start:394 stop:1527 length:1134 start_codon:yes stop_codon:yes gene_type:complete
MAHFVSNKNKVGKIYYYSEIKNAQEGLRKRIPLGTDYSLARDRHRIVEQEFEKEIKQGKEFESYGWEIGSRGKAKIKKKNVGQYIDEWLEMKKVNVSDTSHRRYAISLKAFTNVISRIAPLSSINNKSFETFKRFYTNKHTNGGINLNLRGVKCFFIWCLEEGYIKKMPKIKMMPTTKSKPKTFNEGQWKAIMKAKCLTEWWRDVFRVYKQIGIRLSEGILGEIQGNILIIRAEDSKTRMEKEIPLNEYQVGVIQRIQIARDDYLKRGSLVAFKNRFSRKFADALKEIGIYESKVTTFHCLRHTFAVRRYLETRDIYQVCKELGHTSIKTTEIYTQFSFARLEQDYPSLVKRLEITPKKTLKTHTQNYQFFSPPLQN